MKSHASKWGTQGALVKFFTAAALMAGVVASQQAYAGIANTKHNLGTNSTQANRLTAGTSEICVFCHTPHAATSAIKAPLWNKPASGATYSLYNTAYSSSIQGSVDMTGISVACLSCHDGTQAMDTMINAPGSGNYAAGGARLSGAAWQGAAADGKMPAGIANLGSDLTNDHPVGIQYCGGGLYAASSGDAAPAKTAATDCADKDFRAPAYSNIGGSLVWWVDVPAVNGETEKGTSGTRDKTDMQLYARAVVTSDTTTGKFQPFVECASCHDPHSENATFLRTPNNGSQVCLTCHNK